MQNDAVCVHFRYISILISQMKYFLFPPSCHHPGDVIHFLYTIIFLPSVISLSFSRFLSLSLLLMANIA